MPPLRILFMGSPEMSVPSLKALLDSEHQIVGVVSQPDKPAGRGRVLTPPAVAAVAREKDLPLFQPEKIKGNAEFSKTLRDLSPDLIAIVAYGKILPQEILDLPKHRCVNLHFSFLPKYRGAAPVQWALINDEPEAGVTTFQLVSKVDAGPIYLQKKVTIQEEDTTAILGHRLAVVGASLLLETIRRIAEGDMTPIPQHDADATLAPPLIKENGWIDWKKRARLVLGQIRGMNPWPGAYTTLRGKKLVIHHAEYLKGKRHSSPGEIIASNAEGVEVACGSEAILLKEVQMEGGRKMNIEDFRRGHSLVVGEHLGV